MIFIESQSSLLSFCAQVNELAMQNEYQLRLKDMDMNEKIRELTDKFSADMEADKHKLDLLLQVGALPHIVNNLPLPRSNPLITSPLG